MAQEIERQFVVDDQHPEWLRLREILPKSRLIQATIYRGERNKLRVRIIDDLQTGEKKAFFAFKVKHKTKKDEPTLRDEYEWEVPPRVALYSMIGHIEVYKVRYHYIHTDGAVWDIDEYEGANAGIALADLELDAIHTNFSRPCFLGKETTKNKNISNNSFSTHPYANWSDEEKIAYHDLKQRVKMKKKDEK